MSASFFPDVLYADADGAIEWLENTLGFARRDVHRDDDGHVVHAELELDGAVVMLASGGVGREPFASMPVGCALIYCATPETEALYERAKEAGADIALELTQTDYGSTDFSVRDPEGNIWAFGTYKPA